MNGKTNVTTTSNGSGTNVPHIPPNDFIVAPGDAKTQITWTDPNDLYASPEGVISQAPYQLVSKWTSTKIVRSETDYPATPNDGILAVESNIRDEHKTSVFEDINLNNGTVYYYSAFGMNEQGLYSQPSTQYAEVRASIPMADGYVDGTLGYPYESCYYSPTVMCTSNHIILYGDENCSNFDGNAMAITTDGTSIALGRIYGNDYDFGENSTCSIDGYAMSIGGRYENYPNVNHIDNHWAIYSPELTKTTPHYPNRVVNSGLAATDDYVIACGGSVDIGTDGQVVAVTTTGTYTELTPLSYNTNIGYGGTINNHAIFAVDTGFGKNIVVDNNLTESFLPMNVKVINTYSQTLASANTPNHILFVTGIGNAQVYDNDFTFTTASNFDYTRQWPQGITIGNYAMFIGGVKAGAYPKYDDVRLNQIWYYDISLTLNKSDSIDNPIENPNPDGDSWWPGPWQIIKYSYTCGGTINNIGYIVAFAYNGTVPRLFKFNLA